MNRREFLTKAFAGAVTIPAGAAAATAAAAEAPGAPFLRDLSRMLRSRIPLEDAIARLAQKYDSSSELTPLCRDLLGDLRGRNGRVDEKSLIAIFEKHASCFTASQVQRIRDGIRSGALDQVA